VWQIIDPWVAGIGQYSFTNDGANSGNHVLKLEPDVDTPTIILGIYLYNGDAAARTAQIGLFSAGGTIVGEFYTASLGAGAFYSYPADSTMDLLIDGDTSEIQASIAAVAVSQDTKIAIAYKYLRGGTAPTLTTTGPTNCTIVGIV